MILINNILKNFIFQKFLKKPFDNKVYSFNRKLIKN